MLRQKMRRLGAILIPLAIAAWGLFALVFLVDLDAMPEPLRWLMLVFGLAVTLALGAVGWFRFRNQQIRRNRGN